MKNLLLVGAGNIGSRHLQGLVELKDVQIVVVEPDRLARELALERYLSLGGTNKSVEMVPDFNSGDFRERSFSVCIVATSSRVRLQVIEKICNEVSVDYFILEKFLFPSLDDYVQAANILKDTPSWVNCPMRLYPLYRSLHDEILSGGGPIQVRYQGGEWIGLGCNSIHYVNLVSYLTGHQLVSIDATLLDPIIVDSKRAGYVEFTGKLHAHYGDGSLLSVDAIAGSTLSSTIEIETPRETFFLEEDSGEVRTLSGRGLLKRHEMSCSMPFQSELTGSIVSSILDSGECDLPLLKSSSAEHSMLLAELLDFYNEVKGLAVTSLPIT
jgi:hypothetical protein